ncbi:hypothetical protein HDV03_003319 [Kappamyces sp. JEL0829]|nr:hypothetical protein HDV03_003319 [Kappamyces sp. JEL0829]
MSPYPMTAPHSPRSAAGTGHTSGGYSSQNSEASQLEEEERVRKSNHSAIEKRRRQKLQETLLKLKGSIPNCLAREKVDILNSAIRYIQYLKQENDKLTPQRQEPPQSSSSEPKMQGTHALLALLPSYRPPAHLAGFANLSVQDDDTDIDSAPSFDSAKGVSVPLDSNSAAKGPSVMSVQNLLS